MKNTQIRIGRAGIQIPVLQLLAALPDAVKAGIESGADNHDADSPGGAKVTPEEIAEDVGAFFKAWGEAALPEIVALATKAAGK